MLVTMIDLDAVVETYLGPAIELAVREHKIDAPTIHAVHTKTAPDRHATLMSWLQRYNVFQGLEKIDRVELVRTVLPFADERGCDPDLGPHDTLIKKFDALYARCSNAVRIKCGRNATRRNIPHFKGALVLLSLAGRNLSTAGHRTASTFPLRLWSPAGRQLASFGTTSSRTICSARSLASPTFDRAETGSSQQFGWSTFCNSG